MARWQADPGILRGSAFPSGPLNLPQGLDVQPTIAPPTFRVSEKELLSGAWEAYKGKHLIYLRPDILLCISLLINCIMYWYIYLSLGTEFSITLNFEQVLQIIISA